MTTLPSAASRRGVLGYLADNPAFCAGLALALAFAVLGIIAGARAHSPVPFWDMWDGSLGFYMHQQVDASAWWAQHNEHRIVLARALFFLDLKYFGGQAVFLLIVNYLLAGATFSLLAWCASRIVSPVTTSMKITMAVILGLAFLWTQENNLTWGFQSQFFLAQLLPLVALVLLWKSSLPGQRRHWWFAASLGVGVIAAGSMANGVVASWLIFAGCVVGRQGWRRSVWPYWSPSPSAHSISTAMCRRARTRWQLPWAASRAASCGSCLPTWAARSHTLCQKRPPTSVLPLHVAA